MNKGCGCSNVIAVFLKGKPRKIKNDTTDGENLRYHGNRIAYRKGNDIYFSLCGWNTPTTRLRLNILLGMLDVSGGFSQMKHEPYLGSVIIGAHEWFKWTPGLSTADEIITYNMMTQQEAA